MDDDDGNSRNNDGTMQMLLALRSQLDTLENRLLGNGKKTVAKKPRRSRKQPAPVTEVVSEKKSRRSRKQSRKQPAPVAEVVPVASIAPPKPATPKSKNLTLQQRIELALGEADEWHGSMDVKALSHATGEPPAKIYEELDALRQTGRAKIVVEGSTSLNLWRIIPTTGALEDSEIRRDFIISLLKEQPLKHSQIAGFLDQGPHTVDYKKLEGDITHIRRMHGPPTYVKWQICDMSVGGWGHLYQIFPPGMPLPGPSVRLKLNTWDEKKAQAKRRFTKQPVADLQNTPEPKSKNKSPKKAAKKKSANKPPGGGSTSGA